ncbi:MAG: transposase [Chitinophagia bacterium]|jgi:putative transposase
MSWSEIWVHAVFATKNRCPYLNQGVRIKLFDHMKEVSKVHNIHSAFINGYTDHCHILFSLDKQRTIAEIMKIIKGESSFWLNKSGLINETFRWQDDYWASSVSPTHLPRVRNYIANQELHHSKTDLTKELEILSSLIR